MKIRIQRHSFLKQFLTASQAAAVRDVKPVLMNILLKADKTGTFFMATDMDVGLKLPVTEIDVLNPGCVMLPVKHVRAILTESRDETLEITVRKDNVTIRGAKSSFVLPTQDTEEFPEIREPDEGDHVSNCQF